MKTILINCCYISPVRGSEWSVAWNHIIYMSKFFKLIVLYGTSEWYIGEKSTLDKWLDNNRIENVEFVYVKPSLLTCLGEWLNKKGFIFAHYPAIKIWQRDAYKLAKRIIEDKEIDLIHHLGPIGYREPGFLWKIERPYIWGPIGGANNAPKGLMKGLPISAKLKQKIRSVTNQFKFKYNVRLRNAVKATDVLLTATSENHDKFKYYFKKESIIKPENSIIGDFSFNLDKYLGYDKLRLIVVGRLDAGKAVNILLEAISLMRNKDRIILDIVGDGPQKNQLVKQAQHLKINDQIIWHGLLPRGKAIEIFSAAHLHVICSISEGNPTTIWEAMIYGVPTLSFDHCGMHDSLKENIGWLIPIKELYDENIQSLANALDDLIINPKLLKVMAINTMESAQNNTWEKRALFFKKLYEDVIDGYKL